MSTSARTLRYHKRINRVIPSAHPSPPQARGFLQDLSMKLNRNKRAAASRPEAHSGAEQFFGNGNLQRVMSALRLPRANVPPPGTEPGIEAGMRLPPLAGTEEAPVHIFCADYCPERAECREITDLAEFLQNHRPAWSKVRWINISGGNRMDVIGPFAEKYQLHPLAVEDVVHAAHRPKLEDYPGSEEAPGRLFIVARLVHMQGERLHDEQVSCFLGRHTLLTFQETRNGVFDSIIRRLQVPGSRLRNNDVGFLCYSLLDAIVDSYFPVLEHYSERIEETEEELLESPGRLTLQKAHGVKRGLLLLRRCIWPMREIIAQLQREKHECLSETALTYFRDVYDHCVQIIDLNETYHEIATALTETYMSVMSNRMNEVVKVLTVISTIFIPLTFLAGVYGMNMPIPENHWTWTYPVFWAVCVAIALGMVAWFRRRGWI
jgi:magnesium transporter